MDRGKHVCDVAPGYFTWRSNQVKDMVLPPIDDMVQLTSLLPKRTPIEAKILRSEFEVERKATNRKF